MNIKVKELRGLLQELLKEDAEQLNTIEQAVNSFLNDFSYEIIRNYMPINAVDNSWNQSLETASLELDKRLKAAVGAKMSQIVKVVIEELKSTYNFNQQPQNPNDPNNSVSFGLSRDNGGY